MKNKRNNILRLSAILILIFLNQQAYGIDTLNINGSSVQTIDKYLYTLEDIHCKEPPQKIYERFLAEESVKQENSYISFGYSQSFYWVLLSLRNVTEQTQNLRYTIMDPHLSGLVLYKVYDKNKIEEKYSVGDVFPFEEREIQNKDFVFSIQLAPGEAAAYLLKVDNVGYTTFFPVLLQTEFDQQEQTQRDYLVWGIFFGVLFFVLFFACFMFLSLGDKLYFYYGLYVLSVFIYVCANSGLGYQYLWPRWPEIDTRIRLVVMCMTGGLILHIMQLFIRQASANSKFYLITNITKWVFFSLSFLVIIPFNYTANIVLVNVVLIFSDMMMLMGIFLLFAGTIEKILQKQYVAWYYLGATSVLCVGIFIYILMREGVLPANVITLNGIYVGYLMEILVLTFALTRRYNLHTKEREVLLEDLREQEKQEAVRLAVAKERERKRIAADMHDDLGSGLSGLKLMSEMSSRKISAEELRIDAQQISRTADELTHKMKEIIWALDYESDNIENLLLYIQKYGYRFFEGTDIHFEMLLPLYIPDITLGGEGRKQIYLAVKEAFNNTLKHAGAKNLKCEAEFAQDYTWIIIKDNGKGFNGRRNGGNGLDNIERRMKEIGGIFKLESSNGVDIWLGIPTNEYTPNG